MTQLGTDLARGLSGGVNYNADAPQSYIGATPIGWIDPSNAASLSLSASDVNSIASRVGPDVFANTGAARPTLVASGFGGVPVLNLAVASAQCLIDSSSAIAAAIGAGAAHTTVWCFARSSYGTVPVQPAVWSADAGGAVVSELGLRLGNAGNDDFVTYLYGSATYAATQAVATTAHIVSQRNTGTTREAWANGARVVNTSAGSAATALTQFMIGAMNAFATSRTFDGQIAQGLIFASALSNAQIQRAERWMAIKCGLAAA